MVDTIKFSQFVNAGDLEPNQLTAGLESGTNALFNNPFPLLPPGGTSARPPVDPSMYYRLRFNTDLQSYEYYSPIALGWIQLQDSIDVQTFPFVIYKSEPLLPSSFNLGTLNSGMLKLSVSGGVATPQNAINGTDFWGPGFTGYLVSPSGIADSNSVPILHTKSIGINAVNFLSIQNSTTTNPIIVQPEGLDSDVQLVLRGLNLGRVIFATLGPSRSFEFVSGDSYQHQAFFNFPNTANTVDINFPDASGTLLMTGQAINTVPSIKFSSTDGIIGTTINDNATAGSVGQFIQSVVASGSSVSLTSGTTADMTFIDLPAGDWDVWGNITFTNLSGTATFSYALAWTSPTSATVPDPSLYTVVSSYGTAQPILALRVGIRVPTLRYTVASTTRVYLSAVSVFAVSSLTMCGGLFARRRR